MDNILGKVAAGTDLDMTEMVEAVDSIMRGEWSEEQIGLFLMALRAKGERADEVAGAAAALRQHMTRIPGPAGDFVDTCGTGGDGLGTFNVSTAAAIVTAASGVPVAKHGNRGITSKTGSADVLDRLGVNIDADVAQVQRCLEQVGICFCFAPLMHQSMKHVGPVRKKLGVPTIFNLLGPLCNPAGAPYQLIGVGRAELRPLLAEALTQLGTRRSVVVHGEDGVDEVSLSGRSFVSVVEHDAVREMEWHPSDFGLAEASLEPLIVDGPEASRQVIERVLRGVSGPPRDIVVLNAAAALWVVDPSVDPAEHARAAQQAIDSGGARKLLDDLARVSHEAA